MNKLDEIFEQETTTLPAPIGEYEERHVEPMVKYDSVSGKGVEPSEQDILDDVTFAKRTIVDTIEQAQMTLMIAVAAAKESEHPRSIEVATQAAKVLVDISKDLIGLHEQQKKLNGTLAPTTQNNTQININVHEDTTSNVIADLKARKLAREQNTEIVDVETYDPNEEIKEAEISEA